MACDLCSVPSRAVLSVRVAFEQDFKSVASNGDACYQADNVIETAVREFGLRSVWLERPEIAPGFGEPFRAEDCLYQNFIGVEKL
jgi:hypothetical protein